MTVANQSPTDRGDRREELQAGVDKRVDLAVACGFLLFGCWLLYATTRIPRGSIDDAVGSGGVARVLAVAIIALSGYLVLHRLFTWLRYRGRLVPGEGSADDPVAPATWQRAFKVFTLLAAYVLGVKFVGYLLATPFFLLMGLWVMDVRGAARLAGIAIGYTVGSYALFVGVFGVLLPLGVMDRWDYFLWFHF